MKDSGAVKCYIYQMRRELQNVEYELEQIEQLLADEKYTACYSTNAVGLKYSVQELREVRKYFNRAFRGLLGELEFHGLLGEIEDAE